MIRVAIVDDEAGVRDDLRSMVERFSEESDAPIATAEYESAKAFIDSGATEDIVLLDIEMPEINGMDAAHLLRKWGISSQIIFVTNMAQYAIRGYEVGAIDFVVKPVKYTPFSHKFRRAVEAARLKSSSRLAIATRNGTRYVDTSDIVYVEVLDHKLVYHLVSGYFEAWGTLRRACEVLEPFGFAPCNACYLVNLSHVSAVTSGVVTVDGGDELTISRGRKKSFMDALTNFSGA